MLKKYLNKYVIAGVLTFLVAGAVVAFDTYPVYLAKVGTLTNDECKQVAVLAAIGVAKAQGSDIPSKATEIANGATRLAKRVAQTMLDGTKKEDLLAVNPLLVEMMVSQGCMASGGKFDFTEK